MAKTRQSKADILAGIERRKLENAAARREAMRLESTGAEARVVDEEYKDENGQRKTRVIVMGRRIDVFQLLLERGAIPQDSFNAVRAYEEDLATAMGWKTPERDPGHIKGSPEGAPGQNVSQIMIEASRMVRWVEDRLTTRDWRLLSSLLHENDGSITRWRDTVQLITGEMRDEAHAVAVRHAAANLKDVRDRYQDGRRMAA